MFNFELTCLLQTEFFLQKSGLWRNFSQKIRGFREKIAFVEALELRVVYFFLVLGNSFCVKTQVYLVYFQKYFPEQQL